MPRGARAPPPGRDRGRPRGDARRRRAGRRDRHVPGLAPEARRVGPRRPHARRQREGRPDRAQSGRRVTLRRRLDRPDRLPPGLRRPDARQHLLPRARGRLRRAGERARRGRRRPADHRDCAGHPRGQGRDLRRARGVQGDRHDAADPVLGLAAAQRRQDAARHRHLRGPHDADRARRPGDRAQLLDRPRGHARRDPLPRRALPPPRPLHPERGPAAPGPRRRDDLPREARAAGRVAGRVRRALRRERRRRLLRHDARPHPRDRRAREGPRAEHAPAGPPTPRLLDDRRHAARAGAAPDDRRRARQLAGLAQGEGDAAGRRLRRPAADRREPGRGRRAHPRPLRRADRAPGRGRADGDARQEGLALPPRPDPGRLDRARRDEGGAGADPRPRDRQLGEPGGRSRQARPRRPALHRARRRADRADDRRGVDGEDAPAQGRRRPPHPRLRLRRARDGPADADLRRAHVHARNRLGRVQGLRDRDDRGHPRDQGRAAGRADLARRLERLRSASAERRARS